ncbi:hypothetical protein C8F01DRAFT_1311436, partial [Mycena amicta]
AVGRNGFRKLLRLGHRIFNSGTLRKNVVEIAPVVKVSPKLMKRAVGTRWNTVTDVLESGLDISPILDRLCTSSSGRKNIRSLQLSNAEWQVMSQLFNLLDIFRDATYEVSTNRFPCLHVIIPLIDILNQHLEDAAKRKTTDYYAPIVSLAALKGLAVLDKYYGKTDESIMYRAAMGMLSAG